MILEGRSAIATKLRELRTAAGLSRVQLADKAGLSAQAIFQVETDRRDPAFSTMRKLARALGVPLNTFDLDDEPTDQTPTAPPAIPRPISKRK